MFPDFLGPLKIAFSILGSYWWLYTPILLCAGTLYGWVNYVTQKYLLSLKWTLLEIKPPPDVEKSPKMAENLFAGLHGTYLPVIWKKRFFKGEVPVWFSFEIVGNGGSTNFYVRVQESLRSLVENQIFAQYPDAEIKIADDYVGNLPGYLPNEEYDLFGADLVFNKEDAYPIKTYPFFEEESGRGETKRTDPLAPLAETLGALEPGEHIWIQILIRPTGDSWVKESKAVVDKIIGKEVKIERGLVGELIDLVDQSVFAAKPAEKEEEKKEFSTQRLTPGQRFTLEQVEGKLTKLAFKSGIRFLYISRKELFHRSHISAIIGMFKQLYSNNLNAFRPHRKTISIAKGYLSQIFPSDKGFFAAQQEFRRKWKIFWNYKKRAFIRKVMILNTEELATLSHLPGVGVKAPAFPRAEAKKGQPPAGLPT